MPSNQTKQIVRTIFGLDNYGSQGVLQLFYKVGHRPSVFAAGVGRACFLYFYFFIMC